ASRQGLFPAEKLVHVDDRQQLAADVGQPLEPALAAWNARDTRIGKNFPHLRTSGNEEMPADAEGDSDPFRLHARFQAASGGNPHGAPLHLEQKLERPVAQVSQACRVIHGYQPLAASASLTLSTSWRSFTGLTR